MTRTHFIKIRVSEIELEEIKAKAVKADLSISDLFRQLVLNKRLRQNRVDVELIRQVARIGSNINQLARWANTRKERAITLEILLWLNRIYNAVKELRVNTFAVNLSRSDEQTLKEEIKRAD